MTKHPWPGGRRVHEFTDETGTVAVGWIEITDEGEVEVALVLDEMQQGILVLTPDEARAAAVALASAALTRPVADVELDSWIDPTPPCPDCGNDPADDTLHRDGCRRIGTCGQLSTAAGEWLAEPWHPLDPLTPRDAAHHRGTHVGGVPFADHAAGHPKAPTPEEST